MSNPILLLDLDGTLADTRKDLIAVLNRITAPFGIPAMTEDQIGAIAGRGAKAMIHHAFTTHARQLPAETLDKLFQQFLDDYETNIAVETVFYDGALDALDQLSGTGWILAICTNKLEYLAARLLEQMGVRDRFEFVCGSDTFETKKPDPLPLLKTIELSGGTPQKAVMLGDTSADILAARAAGIVSVAVSFGYSDVPVQELEPDHVIDHFSHLPKLLQA